MWLLLYPVACYKLLVCGQPPLLSAGPKNIQSRHCLCYSWLIPPAAASVPGLTHQASTPGLPQGGICQFSSDTSAVLWAHAAFTLEQAGTHSSSCNPTVVFRVSFLGAEMGLPGQVPSLCWVHMYLLKGLFLLLTDIVLSFWICCCELSLACFWCSWPIQ